MPRFPLALLMTSIALAAVPQVAAAADVRLGGGSLLIEVFGGVGGQDQRRESGALAFDETLVRIPGPNSSPGSAHLRGSATQGDGRASAGGHALIDQQGGHSRVIMRRSFTVGESAPYALRFNVKLRGLTVGSAPPRFQLVLSRGAETVFAISNGRDANWGRVDTISGTLAPGSYELAVTGECRSRCRDDWRASLAIGETTPPVPVVTALTGGPSGVVGQSSALFDFVPVGANTSDGTFRCSLDGGEYEVCTSPHGVSELADGEHMFSVHFTPDVGVPGAPTERRWTVDTASPDVVFDAVPGGADNPPSGEIAFHSSEPEGATFLCSLDAGPLFECASPHRVTNLADGPHSFTVEATDRAGNQSVPNSVTWSVRAPQFAAAPPCAADAGEVKFGPIRVVARSTDACFVDETLDGRQVKVSRGAVALNGIRLTPGPGTRIVVDTRIGDARVRTIGPVTVGFGGFAVPVPSGIDIDRLVANNGRINKAISVGVQPFKAGGASVIPTIATEFTEADGGSAKLTIQLALPKQVFKRLPAGSEGVTVELSPTLSNDRGVTIAGKVTLDTVFLFGRKITDASLFFDHGSGRIGGSGTVALGPEPPAGVGAAPRLAREKVTLTWTLDVVDTACGLDTLSLAAADKNKHIGDGVYLQRLGGSFECATVNNLPVMTLTARGGLSFGPRIDGLPEEAFFKEIASIDGTAKLVIPVGTARPFTLEIEGTGAIVDIPVTRMGLKYTPPLHFEQTASLDLTLAGVDVKLEQNNFYIGLNGYSIGLAGQVDLFGLRAKADGLISTRGFAFCFGPPGKRVGYGKAWGAQPRRFGNTCDVAAFAVAPVAQAAQSGSTFSVARGTAVKVIAIEGAGAPPAIRVDGPGGRRIESPGASDPNGTVLVPDDVADTTFLVLRDPAPGRWTIAPLPGSVALGAVRVADGLPPLKLSARVRGSGARRTLEWTANALGGQRIEFAERGRSGAGRVIATTSRRTGRIAFTPDPALGRTRTIEAIVAHAGLPRATRTVARFSVPPPRRVHRVAAVRLRGNQIRWRAQTAAASYEVAIVRPDGTSTTHSTRRAVLTLRQIPRTGTLRVEVLAVDRLGRPGPITRTRIPTASVLTR